MFGKRRTTLALAAAVAAAGFIGMSAPMASAAITPGGGDFGGLLNVSHNQIPVQLCNDTVPVNVLGGQVPVQELLISLGLASPGNTVAQSNSSCHLHAKEADNNGPRVARPSWGAYSDQAAPATLSGYSAEQAGCTTCYAAANEGPSTVTSDNGAGGDTGGLVNVSDNQIPIQACGLQVPVNVLGIQVPLQNVAGGLSLLSPGNTSTQQDSSCHSGTGQANNNG
ncbi:MAG: hypothetical protein ABSA93_09780 [Streptosporangiaceae bacterium]|jgi:hypothetical protein